MTNSILVSTDIGSDPDDALSLLTMLNAGMNIQGIYCVNGDVLARAYIAKHMTNLANKTIDVSIGSQNPISSDTKPYFYFERDFVPDEFLDPKSHKKRFDQDKDFFKHPNQVGVKLNALGDLYKKLSQGKHDVFSLGPLTDLAHLVIKHPEITKNINHLYIMGCRFSKGKNTFHEHNIFHDVGAAHIIFDSDIPITVIPGNLCEKYKFSLSFLDNIRTPAGNYVKEMALGYSAAKTSQRFIRHGLKDLIEKDARPALKTVPNPREMNIRRDKFLRTVPLLEKSDFGADFPGYYFIKYWMIINDLRDPNLDYSQGHPISRIMEDIILKDIFVPDVFVPYCYLNPDKIKTHRANIVIDIFGKSRKEPGNKHEIVTGIDYNHFQQFLKQYLV